MDVKIVSSTLKEITDALGVILENSLGSTDLSNELYFKIGKIKDMTVAVNKELNNES